MKLKTLFTSILGAIAVLAMTGCGGPWKQIPPGSVGVVFDAYSGIETTVLKPGVKYIGINDHLIIYPTSIHNASYVKGKEGERQADDSIVATTKEGAQLPMDITVVWHVDAANTSTVFANFGTEDLDTIQVDMLRWVAIYGVNVVSGTKSVFDITSKDRAAFGPEVKKQIAPLMATMGITIDDVLIQEVWQPEDITKMVSERIAKSNDLQTVINMLTKAQIDKTTTINNALASASINNLKANQGTEAIEMQRRAIREEAITRWDGYGPVIGDGTIPFVDSSIFKIEATPSVVLGKGK